MKKVMLSTLTVGILTGCGGGGNDSAPKSDNVPGESQTTYKQDGLYPERSKNNRAIEALHKLESNQKIA